MSSPLKLTNNSIGRLAGNVSNAATSFNLQPGEGASFPAIAPGEFFPITVVRASDNAIEIMKVTERAVDALTVERSQENTAALAFLAGDRVELRLTAGTFETEISRVEAKADASRKTADDVVLEEGKEIKFPDGGSLRSNEELKWLSKAIGEIYWIDDSIAGVDTPPTDNPAFRYVKLTASDSYNSGLLTGESVSGSAPNISATAVVDLAGSPLNGQTIRLLNTERKFLRPGSAGVVEANQNLSHVHTATQGTHTHGASQAAHTHTSWEPDGPANYYYGGTYEPIVKTRAQRATSSAQPAVTVNAASAGAITVQATGGNESRPNNVGHNGFMRIL